MSYGDEGQNVHAQIRGGADWSDSCTRCNKIQAVAIDIIQSNKGAAATTFGWELQRQLPTHPPRLSPVL